MLTLRQTTFFIFFTSLLSKLIHVCMDVEARIFEKLDKIEDRLNDLCIRITAMENEYNSHISDMEKKQANKLRRRDYTLAIMAVGLTVIEVCRTLGVI